MKILTKVMDLLALSVILSFMILMFSGCQMASGTLSEKEITVFNTEFFNGDITNMNNMHFYCCFCNITVTLNLFPFASIFTAPK